MKKTYYSVYYVDTQKNDIKYVREFENVNELAKEYELKNKKSVYHYIFNNLDNMDLANIKNKLDNKYIIFKDVEVID